MAKNYVLRGNWYHYMRRVPKRVAEYDSRRHIFVALKTKDEKEAMRMAAIYDDFIQKYWSDLIQAGQSDSDMRLYSEAKALAQAHGFAYKDIAEIAHGSLDDLLPRVRVAKGGSEKLVRSLLGVAPNRPRITLRKCVDRFWKLCGDRFIGKSAHQIRKYKNPRSLALRNFVEVIGNIPLHKIERSHILRFRNALLERVASEQITGNTANKQLGYLKDMLHTVAVDCEISSDFKLLFTETRLQEETIPRPPFEASYVQQSLIDDKQALDGLNEDARMLCFMMMDTGARESEIIGLEESDFFLDEPVPHIWIRKNDIRNLKTKGSDRKIPLAGISLWAAKQIYPRGLSRYHGNPDSASTAINRYLTENNLRPTPKHSLYSLRHTFKDRLRDAGAPEEVIDELMGHKKSGPKYGRGHLLEKKYAWLQKIAYKVPMALHTKSAHHSMDALT